MATDEVVPPFAPWPQVTERRPSLPVSASGPTPEPKADFGSLPDARTRELSRPIAKSTGKLPIAPPGELIVDQQVQAVEKFYRALSAADGKKAAAIVIPAKRGIGPFNEAPISSDPNGEQGSPRRACMVLFSSVLAIGAAVLPSPPGQTVGAGDRLAGWLAGRSLWRSSHSARIGAQGKNAVTRARCLRGLLPLHRPCIGPRRRPVRR